MVCHSHYRKFYQEQLIAEEDEELHVCWYYPYEIELLLEKHGFQSIECINRLLNNEKHMTFIATT